MTKHKKLVLLDDIKESEDECVISVDDIEPVEFHNDTHFSSGTLSGSSAIVSFYGLGGDHPLYHKVQELNDSVDWEIVRYKGKTLLIALGRKK